MHVWQKPAPIYVAIAVEKRARSLEAVCFCVVVRDACPSSVQETSVNKQSILPFTLESANQISSQGNDDFPLERPFLGA